MIIQFLYSNLFVTFLDPFCFMDELSTTSLPAGMRMMSCDWFQGITKGLQIMSQVSRGSSSGGLDWDVFNDLRLRRLAKDCAWSPYTFTLLQLTPTK